MTVRPPVLACVLLATGCTSPDVAPATDMVAPTGVLPNVSPAKIEHAKAPPRPEPTRTLPSTPEPMPPAPTVATPWGSPLRVTGKRRGLHFTTTAQIERTATTLQLALDVELHNSTRAAMNVSLHPPLAMVMSTPAPGSTGEGMGLGLRGEGMGSDVCSPGHGGPTLLPAGGRVRVPRKLVELDPLPWPANQSYRVTASSRDCRPDRLTLEVIDVTIVQPASPDGVPTLVASGSRPSAAR